jgi:hypothetical protein
MDQDKETYEFCKHGREPSTYIKGWEFLEHVHDYWIPKEDSRSIQSVNNNM